MQIIRRVFSYVFVVAIIGASFLALWHRQELYDWYRLRDYTPSAQIETLVENTAMSDYGKKLFYVHDPQLEDRATFNETCTHYDHSIVLGCYITHQSIHIFDVQDERLQGIREVTAAHEMLHAAYDRLGDSEKKEVDLMIITHYEKIKKDHPRIREAVLSYIERDPMVANNELHSIIGTEVRDLPDEIEEYYRRYFTDRQRVVSLAEQYEEVFVEQQDRIKSLADQIQQLELELQGRRSEIQAEGEAIQAESNRLSELRNQGRFEEYNAAVPGYNQRVAAYKANIEAFNRDINTLNNLISTYNSLAVEQKELNSAIDSRATDL